MASLLRDRAEAMRSQGLGWENIVARLRQMRELDETEIEPAAVRAWFFRNHPIGAAGSSSRIAEGRQALGRTGPAGRLS